MNENEVYFVCLKLNVKVTEKGKYHVKLNFWNENKNHE